MDFFTYSFLGLFAFLPSILLLFGLYLIWEQSRLLNRQMNEITRLLILIHQEQQRASRSDTPH
jgi:hypothetical protein